MLDATIVQAHQHSAGTKSHPAPDRERIRQAQARPPIATSHHKRAATFLGATCLAAAVIAFN